MLFFKAFVTSDSSGKNQNEIHKPSENCGQIKVLYLQPVYYWFIALYLSISID